MTMKAAAIYTITIMTVFILTSRAEKVQYISTEHPKLIYYNPKFFSYMNLTAKRYGRANRLYYVGFNFETKVVFANNCTINFYFYEWLTNQYKPGFVEMHFKLCDLIENDMFFGTAIRQGKFANGCPILQGDYHLSNMTIPIKYIPRNFPFTKGRIYCNSTHTHTSEVISSGYIDMEIKETNAKRITKDRVQQQLQQQQG